MPWILPTASTAPLWYGQYSQTGVTSTAAANCIIWVNQIGIGVYPIYGNVVPATWGSQQASAMQQAVTDVADVAAHHRAQERAIRRREEEFRRHSIDAQNRARELLLRHLTEEQRESFLQNKFFVVEGRSKTRYRIEDRGHMVANVAVLVRHVGMEVVQHRLCGHLERRIPMGDQLLAQKFMLEGAEDEFLRLANRHAA